MAYHRNDKRLYEISREGRLLECKCFHQMDLWYKSRLVLKMRLQRVPLRMIFESYLQLVCFQWRSHLNVKTKKSKPNVKNCKDLKKKWLPIIKSWCQIFKQLLFQWRIQMLMWKPLYKIVVSFLIRIHIFKFILNIIKYHYWLFF